MNKEISDLISKEMLGTISYEEKEKLMNWVNSSEDNKAIYENVEKSENWEVFLSTYNKVDVEMAWGKVNSKTFSTNRSLYRFMKYAAALLIPITLAIVFYNEDIFKEERLVEEVVVVPGGSSAKLTLAGGKQIALGEAIHEKIKEVDGSIINSNSKELKYEKPDTIREDVNISNRIETPVGGEFIVTLCDGTKVHLNSLTQLEYPVQFSEDKREVVISGEAYFDVAKDLKRPFIVKTKGVDIRVTGTKFNVKSYEKEDFIETVLVEGGVNVETQEENKIVKKIVPSQMASYCKNDGSIKIEKVNVLLYTNWRNGRFSFQDERLENIMTVLARWYNINVFYQNPEVKDMRFTGSLNKYESIKPILDVIKVTNKVNVNIKRNNIVFRAK